MNSNITPFLWAKTAQDLAEEYEDLPEAPLFTLYARRFMAAGNLGVFSGTPEEAGLINPAIPTMLVTPSVWVKDVVSKLPAFTGTPEQSLFQTLARQFMAIETELLARGLVPTGELDTMVIGGDID